MTTIAESHVEDAALAWLADLGYAMAAGLEIGPDGSRRERENYAEVLLVDRPRAAIARLNPTLTHEAGKAVLAKVRQMPNPTPVVLTDRNVLDDQLFSTFGMCQDLLRQTPQQAEDRQRLQKLLERPSGGVIFTTLQKFSQAFMES